MKAYNMKKKGNEDQVFVRIFKGTEIARDENDNVMEKVGGPIGGLNILPLNIGEEDRFVSFKLDDGTLIKNQKEFNKAYDEMYGIKAVVDAKPEVEAEASTEIRRRGRPKRAEGTEA